MYTFVIFARWRADFEDVSRPNKAQKGFTTLDNSNSFDNVNSNDVKPLGNSGNSNPKNTAVNTIDNTGNIHYGNTGIITNPNGNSGTVINPKNNSGNVINETPHIYTNPKGNGGLTPINNEPIKPVKQPGNNENYNTPKVNTFENTKPVFNNGGNNNSSPSNNTPRGGGSGGGGGRPR